MKNFKQIGNGLILDYINIRSPNQCIKYRSKSIKVDVQDYVGDSL